MNKLRLTAAKEMIRFKIFGISESIQPAFLREIFYI
jgi:hypothetical protein